MLIRYRLFFMLILAMPTSISLSVLMAMIIDASPAYASTASHNNIFCQSSVERTQHHNGDTPIF